MAKKNFSKPALTIPQQIQLLQGRGLAVADTARAERYLGTLGYYRLSGYMYPFLQDKEKHIYKNGATFEQVMDLYFFDRELRLLVFSAIEKIEIAFRTQLVQRFSLDLNNPFWLEDPSIFKNRNGFFATTSALISTLNRSGDVFIRHFNDNYENPFPPAWMVFETLQMGQLSHIFSDLENCASKQGVGNFFGVAHQVLETWIHTLVYIRNICAHHARLWNKVLRIKPVLPKKTANAWVSAKLPADKFFAAFCIIKYLLDIIAPGNQFVQKFESLVAKHTQADIAEMGFPVSWKSEPLFK